jgi:TolA-binding protein
MKNRALSVVATVICIFLLNSCGGGGGGGGYSAPADQQAYLAAVATYDAQSYTDAAAAFRSFIADYPNSNYIDNSHYYLGKSLYHLGDSSGAIAEFDYVLQHYPSSSLIDNSLLWKGKSQQQLANIDFLAGNAAAAALKFADARASYQLVIARYPASTLIPDCNYQIALTYYDEDRFAEARPLFQSVFASDPNSSVADGSLYYLARTTHRLALLAAPGYILAQARADYTLMMTTFPLSTWADNAQYQIGRTYYDELNYVAAITELNRVFANYATPSIADSTYYYLARSIHELAVAGTPGYTYAQARAKYATVLTSYPASLHADNAQYQTGKTYYDELNYVAAITEFNRVFANYAVPSSADSAQYYLARSIHALALAATPGYTYAQARTAYGLVATNYPTSIFADNAVYRAALTYHDSTQCTLELAAMQAFAAAYPLSAYLANAQSHISDLALATPATHTTCI